MARSYSKEINLIMPMIVCPIGAYSPLVVDRESQKSWRRAVWKMAQFFRREFHFDFVQYGHEGDEDDPNHVAYLWLDQDYLPGWRVQCIGACCFRKRQSGMAMQWIWLHPYYRRRGLLAAAWPRFLKAHGKFEVEGPLSEAMQGFLGGYREREKG